MKEGKILIIDDEEDIGKLFKKTLPKYKVIHVLTGKEALDKVKEVLPDIILLDLVLPDMSGVTVLRKIKKIFPDILIIILTAHGDIETAVETMKLGAYDYLTKPLPLHRLKIIIDNAIHVSRLDYRIKELEQDISKTFTIDKIITVDKNMQNILGLIRKAATHDITVLINGESGTGKEMVARAIHYESSRKDGPFVPVDCATLPETLIESELFGHEKGAFTGALQARPGKFELADKGTIFLDEIGNLSDSLQIKLLRILQEREVVRIGAKKSIRVDVRVVTATNKNLRDLLSIGKFRNDLFYRINVFPINLPPFRERKADIVPLSKYFLNKYNTEFGRSVEGIAPETIKVFQEYSWPGNVRELENVIKSAVILADEWIKPEHLTTLEVIRTGSWKTSEPNSLKEASKNAEKNMVEKVLHECKWNKRKAAKRLGVDYKTLYNKMKHYGIK